MITPGIAGMAPTGITNLAPPPEVVFLTCPGFSVHEYSRQWLPLSCEGLMKKVRFTEDQMVMILRDADRSPSIGAAGVARDWLKCPTDFVACALRVC